VIARGTLDEVEAHARASYPDEACGLLAGPLDDPFYVEECLRFENLADRYHALDPEAYPRSAREAYRMNDKKRHDAMERALREGRSVKVLYHSHCDVGAYFSDEDREQALAQGTLLHEVVWLVTSVRLVGDARIVDDHKAFAYAPARDAFEAIDVRIE
jgi:proteasome lid subunit RPN8/RPN11